MSKKLNSPKHPRNGRFTVKSYLLELVIAFAWGSVWSIFCGVAGIVTPWSAILIFLITFSFLMSPYGVRFRDWCWDVTGGK